MSNNKTAGSLTCYKIINAQSQPLQVEVDVNVPNIRGNRTPRDYTKHLESAGGFDWSLWRKPYVIETSVAEGRRWIDEKIPAEDHHIYEKGFISIEGYGMVFRMMFDGGHRREMHKLAFPNAKTMLCDVYKIDSVEQAHMQFVKIQDELQKRLHRDLIFVQSYMGGDKRIARLVSKLKAVGLVVQYEDDVVGEESRFQYDRPSISKNGFDKIQAKFDNDTIKLAVDLLKDSMLIDSSATVRTKFNQYLVFAVCDVIKEMLKAGCTLEDSTLIISKTLDSWIAGWEDTRYSTQSEMIDYLHTVYWKGATLSPTSAGIAFQSLVYSEVLKMPEYPMINVDPEPRRHAIQQAASIAKHNKMKAKVAKAKAKLAA